MKKIMTLILLCSFLQGCSYVESGTGTIQKIRQDQRITNIAIGIITNTPEFNESSHINVSCFNQIILITGETATAEERERIAEAMRNIPNVKRVYNEVTVKGRSSPLTRASDSWITTKIRTEMLATKGLSSTTIKVVTENGTVYLMGDVTQSQADTAVEIARQVNGVQKVVKIFHYQS